MRQLLVRLGIVLPPMPWAAGRAQAATREAPHAAACDAIDEHWRRAGVDVDGPTPHFVAEASGVLPLQESGEFGIEDPIEDTQVAQLAGALPPPIAPFLPGGPPAGVEAVAAAGMPSPSARTPG
eukprot:8637072-Alexandrium_andersonii.AAC.1